MLTFDPNKFEPNLEPSPAPSLNLRTGDVEIDNVNLTRLIAKSMDPYSGYGWDRQTAEEIAGMYRAFLFLCKTYPNEVIVPPREVDEFWHLHILDTRNYHSDCQRLFGYYLHHFPYAGLKGADLPEGQEDVYKENTVRLIARHFPCLLGEGEDATDAQIAQ